MQLPNPNETVARPRSRAPEVPLRLARANHAGHASPVRTGWHSELALKRDAQKSGAREAALFRNATERRVRLVQGAFGELHARPAHFLLDRAGKRGAKMAFEPLSAATHRSRHERHADASARMLANPGHCTRD